MSTPLGLRILFVEDNDEIREALTTLLEGEGYDVTACASAEEGLHALETRGPFHLTISDYALPGETGAWLIREAVSRGLIERDRVLMVTAHPRPSGADGLKVMRKPLDLDDFLAEVYRALAPARAAELERTRSRLDQQLLAQARRPVTVELALYISASSPSSLKALRNVERLLSEYDPRQVQLSICDLSRELTAKAEEDRVAFTPTLVKRSPDPKAWVLGDLENSSVLADLLASAGVERKR